MSGSGFKIQILMDDEAVADFLADPAIDSSAIRIEDTKPAEEAAVLGFDLLGAITIITAIISAIGEITKLVEPLERLLKKSPRPIIVTTAFGTVKLDPTRNLTTDEIRKLLSTLATL